MPEAVATRETEIKRTSVSNVPGKLTGNAFISFISGTQTNIGRSTFYNMEDEQRQTMKDQHSIIMEYARPFYALMALPTGVNDVNKQMIAWNLIEKTIRENGLKDNENSPITMWENEIILQTLDNMEVPRVFDFLSMLSEKKVTKTRAIFLIKEFLNRHKKSQGLWAIKYRKDFKEVLRHIIFSKKGRGLSKELKEIWQYLRSSDIAEGMPKIISDYEFIRSKTNLTEKTKEKLASLPYSVAVGFSQKFNI